MKNQVKQEKNPSPESAELQPTPSLDAAPQFAVGDIVFFTNERGTKLKSVITRIVPVGEYSAMELGYAIRGTYGSYVRVAEEIQLAD